MAENRVVPMLAYEDGAGAIDWLVTTMERSATPS